MTPPSPIERALATAPWLFAVVACLTFEAWTVDDAWILFRYADHLAEFGAATWNPGLPAAEGYTGHLLLGLLAAGSALGLDLVELSRALGVASFLTGAWLLRGTLMRVGIGTGPRLVATSLFLIAPFQPMVATGGLETSLFGCCLLAVIRALAEVAARGADDTSERPELLGWGALLLLAVVRPEGWLLGAAGAAGLVGLRRQQGASWGGLATRSLVLVAPLVALHAARWSAYGGLLPNTWYAKQKPGLLQPASARLLGQFVVSLVAAPVVAALLAGLGRPDGAARRLRRALVWMLAASAVVIVQHLGNHLSMSYGHRFFSPLYGLLLVALALHAPSSIAGWRRLALVAVALGQFALWTREFRRSRGHAREYAHVHDVKEHVRVGLWLGAALPPTARLAAVSDAGQIPYRAGVATLDYAGLCEPSLVRGEPSIAAQVEQFYQWDPDVAVFSSRTEGVVVGRPDRVQALLLDPRFERYELLGSFDNDVWPTYHTLVFAKGASIGLLEATPIPSPGPLTVGARRGAP